MIFILITYSKIHYLIQRRHGRPFKCSKWYAIVYPKFRSCETLLKLQIIGIAVVSLAIQLAGSFIKLYDFWGTVRDAPDEVREIVIDLKLLSRILDELVNRSDPSPHVRDALIHCDSKVKVS